jgi:hypothetical protein
MGPTPPKEVARTVRSSGFVDPFRVLRIAVNDQQNESACDQSEYAYENGQGSSEAKKQRENAKYDDQMHVVTFRT